MRWALPLVLLVGCGEPVDPNEPAPGQAAKPSAKTAQEILDAEPEPAVDPYFYNPAGKRDPFQGFAGRKTGRAVQEMAADAPPLQRWEVDKYVLRGVIWNAQSPRAMLVDPDGIGHVVRVGTYVGRNWGKVTSISQDGVVVTEEYQTLDGELVVNPVTVRFPQSVAGKK